MANGEVYVEVDASVINGGIAPMAIISGNPEPVAGQESWGVWLRWRYDDLTGEGGFTGAGWFWDDENNVLNQQFESEEAFKKMLVDNKPQNLDQYLGNWGAEKKSAFFNENQGSLGLNNCFSFVNA